MRKVGYVSSANLEAARSALASISSSYEGTFSNSEYKDVYFCNWHFKDETKVDAVLTATAGLVKWIDVANITDSHAKIKAEASKVKMKENPSKFPLSRDGNADILDS